MPTAQQAYRNMQGIQVPAGSVDVGAFQRATRRMTVPQKTFSFAGLGQTDNVPMLQVGIIESLIIRLSGSIVSTLSGGTVATTAQWPYGLVKNIRFSANGQSNLINCGGWDLKLRDILAEAGLSDRSVSRGVGGASPGTATTNGTLSLASESWGLGNNVSAVAGAPTTTTFDLFLRVPIAADPVSLTGAVFAQSASTDLNLAIDWAALSDLFTLTGAATVTVACNVVVEAITYSIPQAPNGGILIPDLSMFHSIIRNRNSAVTNGQNEVKLVGAGIGRYLMRAWFRTLNGASPQTPLIPNATNYGQIGWRFGGNDTPELVTDGQHMRYTNERLFGNDISAVSGQLVQDFASQNAMRDLIDESTATELRLLVEIPSGVSLTTPVMEIVQETLFAGSVGA